MKFPQIRILIVMTMAWFAFSKTLTDSKSASKAKNLDVSPIITEIRSKKRTVLLLSLLPKRLFVIVSATGKKALTSDSVVFEESPSSLKDKSVELSWAQLFADKWPKVSLTPGTIGVLSDSCADYLVLANADKLQMLNLATGDIAYKTMGGPFKSVYETYFEDALLLSSSQPMTIWAFTPKNAVYSGLFNGSDLVSSPGVTERIKHISICKVTDKADAFQTEGMVCGGTRGIPWKITAGLLTPLDAYLVDATSGTVLRFKLKEHPFIVDHTTTFKAVSFGAFWGKAKGKPLALEPVSARCTPKGDKEDKGKEDTGKDRKLSPTPDRASRTWVVILSVLLCITFLYALIITGLYLFSKVPNASMHSGKSSSNKGKSSGKLHGKLPSGSKIPAGAKAPGKAAPSKMASTGSAI